MQFTTVRSKQNDYNIYLKSEKLVHSQQEHEKNVSQLFGSGKNWFLAISSLTNTVAAIWREKKFGSLLFGDQKMQFTTVRSKEKDYDIYLMSEKLDNSQQEQEKNVSLLFGSGKNWFLAISSLTNTVAAIWREKKWIPAIWRPKIVVHTCQGQRKRLFYLFKVRKTGSLPVGSRKKCFPAIWKWKKLVPTYFEPDKHCCSYLEREKSGSLLF